MKKMLALILALTLLVGLVACGGKTETPAQPEEPGNVDPVDPVDPVEPEYVPNTFTMEYEAPQKSREVKNILILGNSFSNRMVDELAGIIDAAGYDANVCNIYRAGCTVGEHWRNLSDDTATTDEYSFFVTTEAGRVKKTEITTINAALAYADWDVIGLQHHFDPDGSQIYNVALNNCAPHAEKMFNYLKENHPNAKLLWYETWAFEVGYADVRTEKIQTKQYDTIRDVSVKVTQDNGVGFLPCGDAWQIVRHDTELGDTLCLPDKAHDGDVQGGQMLNSYVWFEVMFGDSCIGNTYRPTTYKMDEARVLTLQEVAHEAVTNVYGEAFYQ